MQDKNELLPLIRANNSMSKEDANLEKLKSGEASLSILEAAWNIARFSLPFTISRVAVAVNVLSNGYITPKIGADAAAAGPSMISIVYAVLGPGRSIILATGILIGKKYGEFKSLVELGRMDEAKKVQEEIGTQLRQSTIFATMLGIPSIAFMVAMGPILKATGMEKSIANNVQKFLVGTATGLLPMFWSTGDQQFAMATGYRNIPMIFGSIFPAMSMLLGYPFALGVLGLPKLGTAGLGYGMSASAWISFIGLRLYFLREEFAPYNIYKMELKGLFGQFSDLLKLGLPLGFQALTEWGNLFLLSTLIARKGLNASMAANGSFQIITAVTLITAAIGQGISVKIAEHLGRMKIAEAQGNLDNLHILNQNSKRMGHAGIAIGALTTAAIAGLLIARPRQITTLFVSTDAVNHEEVMVLAQAMLITNAIGLIFDTVRNMSASALGGSKDVLFAPIFSLLMMTALAIGAGAIATEVLGADANWMFITRDLGILIAAIGISMRWLMKDHTIQFTNAVEEMTDEPRSCAQKVLALASNPCGFFKSCITNEELTPLLIQQERPSV